jgi:hypothetical protein
MTRYIALIDTKGTAWAAGVGEDRDSAIEDADHVHDLICDEGQCPPALEDLEYQDITAAEYRTIKEFGGVGWRQASIEWSNKISPEFALANDTGDLWKDVNDLAEEQEIERLSHESDHDFGQRVLAETKSVLCRTGETTWAIEG